MRIPIFLFALTFTVPALADKSTPGIPPAAMAPDAGGNPLALACAPGDEMRKKLAREYGELPVAVGETGGGGGFVITARPDGKTFTIIGVDAQGRACMLADGKHWILKIGQGI